MEQKFYICKHCKQIVAIVRETGAPLVCCGDEMVEIKPGTTDAAVEKHVPVLEVSGNIATVTVGSVEHPMTEAHLIEWISIQTNFGNQRKTLKANDKPVAKFALLDGEKVEAVYAYCNLHSLWKK